MATNDSLRWGRTQIRRSIQETYNIKAKRLNDPEPKKGLKIHFAQNNNLDGKITAGHKPISLSAINRVRQTKTGVSVMILKGERTVIQRAFILRNKGGAVFARGIYTASGFYFRHGINSRKNKEGNDTPITSIQTVSVATAALNTRSMAKWSVPIQRKFDAEVARQISRLMPNGRI